MLTQSRFTKSFKSHMDQYLLIITAQLWSCGDGQRKLEYDGLYNKRQKQRIRYIHSAFIKKSYWKYVLHQHSLKSSPNMAPMSSIDFKNRCQFGVKHIQRRPCRESRVCKIFLCSLSEICFQKPATENGRLGRSLFFITRRTTMKIKTYIVRKNWNLPHGLGSTSSENISWCWAKDGAISLFWWQWHSHWKRY